MNKTNRCKAVLCDKEATTIVVAMGSKYRGRLRCDRCAKKLKAMNPEFEVELIPIEKDTP